MKKQLQGLKENEEGWVMRLNALTLTVLPFNYTCSEGRADVKEREMSFTFSESKSDFSFYQFH